MSKQVTYCKEKVVFQTAVLLIPLKVPDFIVFFFSESEVAENKYNHNLNILSRLLGFHKQTKQIIISPFTKRTENYSQNGTKVPGNHIKRSNK